MTAFVNDGLIQRYAKQRRNENVRKSWVNEDDQSGPVPPFSFKIFAPLLCTVLKNPSGLKVNLQFTMGN